MESEFYKQPTLPGVAAETPVDPIPEMIGPYKIESLLSRGGMSLLYLGSHPKAHQPLAIKVLSPQFVSQQHMKEQFLKESKIIGLTDHPNIVKLFGQGEWENGLYIAMEFIQGVSLKQFITQHSLSLKRALEIILGVAYALLHLHTHGVIHRDLKPENIIITENGGVKVIDFGIARLSLDLEKTKRKSGGGVIGTPSYMSPEQKNDPSNVTYATDIYALGIIAYELTVGKLSFGSIEMGLLPKQFKSIIEKTLAPSLEERYQDIVDFITDISNYLKSEEIQKDLSGGDNLKHLWEDFSNEQKKLLPSPPQWQDIDFAIVKPEGMHWPGLYLDFFSFNDRSHLILMGKAESNVLESMVSVASLRGMARMLIKQSFEQHEKKFDPLLFTSELNMLFSSDTLTRNFYFNVLYIDSPQNDFYFLSCGESALWHIPHESSSARLHMSPNPLLGKDPNHNFVQVTDNWHEGDTLLFHSQLDQFYTPEQEQAMRDILLDHVQLSSKAQAETLLQFIRSTFFSTLDKPPCLSLCAQRIT